MFVPDSFGVQIFAFSIRNWTWAGTHLDRHVMGKSSL